NVPQDAGSAMLHTVEQVEEAKDGGIRILTDNGGLYITAGKDTEISPLYTKNIVQLEDVKEGDRIFAWYNIVLESYPGQTYTNKLVLIPGETEPQTSEPVNDSFQIVLDGDMVLSQEAVMKDGVAMVPLRAVAEALGCEVTWDRAERAATINDGTRTMTFTIGMDLYVSAAAPQTGLIGMTSPTELGAAPYLDAEGRTWVPAEAFEVMVGYEVSQTETAIEIIPQK
ncbi:MAG: copper amine oxidase N-terminal domain-containing protein, partial [Butyricicoccus sp.]